MYRKSRIKIIASIMISLVFLLCVTLSVIIASEYYDGKKQNYEMLNRFVNQYSLGPDQHDPAMNQTAPENDQRSEKEARPSVRINIPDDKHLFQISTFYSVTVSENGEVIDVDAGNNSLYQEYELIDLANSIISSGEKTGERGSVSFQVENMEGYILVAFKDNSVTDIRLASLIKHTLIVGLCVIVVMFFFSVFISRIIVRPLELNNEKQKQFISDAGHELKTPVSVISANATLLSRQIGKNEWLDNICYENDKMGDLITQLLDLSKAENAKVQMENIDFSRLVAGETLLFESIAFEKGFTLNSDIADGISVHGNRTQLSQLVSILIDNAIRHSEGGKEVFVFLESRSRNAVLKVENYGKEIPEEKMKRLFDRFYRVDDARTDNGNNYGLGLAIAKAVSEKHGGHISVACSCDKVVFTVTLPIKNDMLTRKK